jgi:5-methylcytosine-specific restriction endonuclease McrA
MPSTRTYPDNWPALAAAAKAKSDNRCERCGIQDSHNPKDGHCLTVHHLVPDTTINEAWNLAALCQRCHLRMQHVNLFQEYFYQHSDWFIPHLKGFQNWRGQNEAT